MHTLAHSHTLHIMIPPLTTIIVVVDFVVTVAVVSRLATHTVYLLYGTRGIHEHSDLAGPSRRERHDVDVLR